MMANLCLMTGTAYCADGAGAFTLFGTSLRPLIFGVVPPADWLLLTKQYILMSTMIECTQHQVLASLQSHSTSQAPPGAPNYRLPLIGK